MSIRCRTHQLLILCAAGLIACGADTPPDPQRVTASSQFPDPCELLTFAEIDATLGLLPEDTVHSDVGPYQAQCVWSAAGDPHPILVLGITTGASSSWEEYVEGMLEDDRGDPRENGERVDVGHFGLYDGSMLQVHASGGWLLTLASNRGDPPRDAAMQLGRSAVARLP